MIRVEEGDLERKAVRGMECGISHEVESAEVDSEAICGGEVRDGGSARGGQQTRGVEASQQRGGHVLIDREVGKVGVR